MTLISVTVLALTLLHEPASRSGFQVFASGQPIAVERMLDELARADVVFIGENHDHKLGHEIELDVLKGVHARKVKTALSLEMFERDVQGVLDEYLQGHITEPHFLQSSRPWPNYKSDYAPLVNYARDNKLPVIAANAPRRYVNIVSRKGQAALRDLPKASREHFAATPYSMEIPAGYDRMLHDLFSSNHGSASAAGMPTVENMKQSQGLWDATMADSILKFARRNRGWTIVQINGAGHSDHGYGIVDRIRKANPRLSIKIVSIKPDSAYPGLAPGKYEGIADYLILTPIANTAQK